MAACLSPSRPRFPHIPGGEGVSYGRIGKREGEGGSLAGTAGTAISRCLSPGREDDGLASRSFFRCRGEKKKNSIVR